MKKEGEGSPHQIQIKTVWFVSLLSHNPPGEAGRSLARNSPDLPLVEGHEEERARSFPPASESLLSLLWKSLLRQNRNSLLEGLVC